MASTIDSRKFRAVPLAEIENEHTFHTLRHFPVLRQSVVVLEALQIEKGRDLTSTTKEFKHFRRNKQNKFTHRLEKLTKSSLGEIHSLHDFRKIISEERMKEKASTLEFPPRAVVDNSTLSREQHLEIANAKLTKFAVSYDAGSVINILAGFQGNNGGGWINKAELEVQLRRCLNIILNKEELEAIFLCMDDNNNGLIEGVEFTRYFFRLGNEARHKTKLENEARHLKQQLIIKHQFREDEERFSVVNDFHAFISKHAICLFVFVFVSSLPP